MGGRVAVDLRIRRAVLLDAARMDDARMWALAGGVLAVIEFGPLNQWMNGYWGGTLAAVAGCMVFGALPRLAERVNTQRRADTRRRDCRSIFSRVLMSRFFSRSRSCCS